MSDSCRELGLVTGITGENRALVTVHRAEACHSCSVKGACSALGGQTKDLVLEAENDARAQPGDRVTLSMPQSSVVKASMVLYLLPALGLVAGAVLGREVALAQGWITDPASITGSFLGLVVGFAISKVLSKKMGQAAKYRPRITAIAGRS